MSLLGIGTTLAGMGYGEYSNERQNRQDRTNAMMQYQNQRNLNKQGHRLQMDMWNKTNYEAQVKHMKEAGLNPALMYGSAGQGGTTGSQGGGSASKAQAPKAPVMDMSNILAGKQAALLDAQARKTNEEANKISGVDTGKVNAEIDNLIKLGVNISKEGQNIDAKRKNIEKDTELKETQRFIGQINGDWLNENGLSEYSVKEVKLIEEIIGERSTRRILEIINKEANEALDWIEDPVDKMRQKMEWVQEQINRAAGEIEKRIKG